MNPQLPNLFVIGAMKSGTTSLHQYLALHPEVFMAQAKEIDFFIEEERWHLGLDWYKEHFVSEKAIRGESSQDYSKRHLFKGVPEKIHKLIPEAKLIYLLRDPLERIQSHYFENIQANEAPDDLNQYLQEVENNHYVLTSAYYYQLEAFLEYFPPNQILLVQSERLKTERLTVMNEIFRFLELDEIKDEHLFDFAANDRSIKKKPNQLYLLSTGKVSQSLRQLLPDGFRSQLRNSALFKKLAYSAIKEGSDLKPEVVEKIKLYLAPDIAKLRAFSGQPFQNWSI